MKKIYSKVNPSRLLHIIVSYDETTINRRDFTECGDPLQISSWIMPIDKLFKPHQHLHKEVPATRAITQEAIIVIAGMARAYYYDIDDTFLEHVDLTPGIMTITLAGGHAYKSFVVGTKVFEFKSGPYLGVDVDKRYIEDPLCGY